MTLTANRMRSAFNTWRVPTPKNWPCLNCKPPFPNARGVAIRMLPLMPEDRVVREIDTRRFGAGLRRK
jgi:hypothetical protein